MPTQTPAARSSCAFTFADGRRCRMPRAPRHPYLCAHHARKEAQTLAGDHATRQIAHYLSGQFVSACDVSAALARLFAAVAQGHINPKTAATLAYLGQTLAQTLPLSRYEFINAFGTNAWRHTIASSFAPSQPKASAPAPVPPVAPQAPAPQIPQART